MGHLHLHVGDVDRGLAFYRDVLGFEEQANLGSAAFVSAGGYHHHLGFNVWRGPGVGPAPEHTVGLRHWTVVLPTAETSRPCARGSPTPTEQSTAGSSRAIPGAPPWRSWRAPRARLPRTCRSAGDHRRGSPC